MPFSISNEEILETVKMLSEDKLNIRTPVLSPGEPVYLL